MTIGRLWPTPHPAAHQYADGFSPKLHKKRNRVEPWRKKDIVKSVYPAYFCHDVLQVAVLSDNNIENVNLFHVCIL